MCVGRLRIVLLGVLHGSVLLGTTACAPETVTQPLPFSHKSHINNPRNPKLKIECVYCHDHAGKGDAAGIPGMSTCMPCHSVMKLDTPDLRKLKEFDAVKREIPWLRVAQLPSHNLFSHKRHVKAEIDCTHCHGDVGAMTETQQPVEFTMAYCFACHVARGASVDCLVCHK